MSILNKLLTMVNILDKEVESNEKLKESLDKTIELIDSLNFDSDDIISVALEYRDKNCYKDYRSLLEHCLDLQAEIFNNALNELHKQSENDLNFILYDNPEQLKKELESRDRLNIKFIKMFEIVSTMMKHNIRELSIYSEVSPKIERKLQGKIPKAKKQEQIQAEDWAKEVWAKYPSVTQEQMAIDIKDKLDLKQSIQTIIRWVRPFQPKK